MRGSRKCAAPENARLQKMRSEKARGHRKCGAQANAEPESVGAQKNGITKATRALLAITL